MRDDAQTVRDRLLRMALDDVRRADHRSAIRRYKRLTGLDPDNPTLHLKVAELSLRLENKSEAVEAYLKAAALFARDAFDAKAVSLYNQALAVDPTRHEISDLLAAAHQRLGRVGDAIECLRSAARALGREGRDAEALHYRRKVAQLDPGDTARRLGLARELERAGLRNDSVAEYVEVAVEFARQGELERIPGVFESIVQMKPEEMVEFHKTSERNAERGLPPDRAQLDFHSPRKGAIDGSSANDSLCLGYQDSLETLYRRVARLHRERS